MIDVKMSQNELMLEERIHQLDVRISGVEELFDRTCQSVALLQAVVHELKKSVDVDVLQILKDAADFQRITEAVVMDLRSRIESLES